jgi:hypothetical protein
MNSMQVSINNDKKIPPNNTTAFFNFFRSFVVRHEIKFEITNAIPVIIIMTFKRVNII